MKQLKVILVTVMVLLLQACGGGGTPQADPRNPMALFTNAGGSLTMLAASVGTSYAITGGVAPYSASSSNASVATTSVNGTSFSVTPGLAGSALIRVTDAKGSSVEIAVTVAPTSANVALYTTAPSAITMSGDAAPASFLIRGGVPPYGASTSNAGVAAATVNGAELSVRSVANGSATLLVFDAVGSKVEISVVVGAASGSVALATTAPSVINMDIGAVLNYKVSGGKAPYSVRSPAFSGASVNLFGTTLVVSGSYKGTTSIVVLDSAGAEVLISVIVGAAVPSPLYMTAPATVIVANGAAPATYTIGGGTPPYAAASSNSAVLTASVTGATLSLTGLSAGMASVDVTDASGARVSTAVTVSATTGVAGAALNVLPSGAAGNVGDTLSFTLLGGSPPYKLDVSNSSVASVSSASVASSGSTFTTKLNNVGSTVVTVLDAQGQTTSLVLTVGSVSSQLRLSPSVFLVGENEAGAVTLNIFGGTGPYRALTSDLVKSSVSISSSTVVSGVGTSGNRCINPVTADQPPVYINSGTYDITLTVIDSLGASATSTMTIKDNGAGLNAGCP
jgi:hypothetical protein